ncbi:hemagglutinin repeat-containing protein [Candidatus Thioglobus sp.]|uniref:two-partner secretion domain-containing protein n=1 Tax=Candidatus Thioglobus sp. TaxID=2026721 RepID=UPI003D101AA5
MLKKLLFPSIAFYITLFPLAVYSAPLQTDGSTNTTLDKARNNVPIVNIANPNARGLSHNKFIHYNVGNEGLILNNSNQTNINTQLGGIIFGNANLTNQASAILNEVTSSNRTVLNGWTEVAGQRADLIIANPNGLSINGAGFINTNNITLTTGSSSFSNNQLSGFTVNGGDVLIQGVGLDASNQDSVNIYSHYLQLNAKINAKNLNIKLGKNSFDANGNITQSTNSEQTQNLLLDTSNLGGMYANRITLVGTDQGLGVNLPPEVLASAGDIFISNDGKISLQALSAKADVQITSTEDIEVNNNLYSQQTLTIHADNTIEVKQGIIAAKDTINISSNEFNNQAQIIAGLNADSTQNSNGILNITANSKLSNAGNLQATQDLNLATNELGNQTTGNIIAGNNLSIKKYLDSNDNTKTSLITNAGTLHGNNNNAILAATLNNANGNITASENLNITANNITTTDGEFSGKNTSITANNLDSTDTNILAANNIDLAISNLLTNKGNIQANQTLTLGAKILANHKLIVANNAAINATTVNNHVTGTLHAQADLTIITDDLANNNQISSDNQLTIAVANTLNNQNAKIIALGDMSINANNLNNQNAQLIGYKANNMTVSQNINNTDGDISAKNLSLNTQSIDLENSNIYASKDLTLTLGALDNTSSSKIGSGGDLSINANDYIANSAELTANGNLTLNTQGALTNNNLISSKGVFNIQANSLTNNNTISAGTGHSHININNDIINHSRISSQQHLSATAQNITNNGFFNAGQDLSLTTTNNLTNNKTLFSGNDMSLYVTNELNNTQDANIFAFNNLTIAKDASNNKTNKVINDKAAIQTYQGDISIYAKLLENKTDAPDVTGSYDADTQVITGGVVLSNIVSGNTTTTIEAVILNNSSSPAQINSGKDITLFVDNINNQYSAITAANNIHLSSEVVDNQAIQIVKLTTTNTRKYHDYRHRHKWYKSKHSHHDYVGTDTQKSVEVVDVIASTIQAGGSITGNINNLNNGNINQGVAVSTNPNQTQNTTTNANNSAINQQNIDVNTQVVNAQTQTQATTQIQNPTTQNLTLDLPQGDYGLFVQTQDPQAKYLIESNPEFTLYNNFISSDYLLKHVNFNPDAKLKLIGDGFYQQKLIREQLLAQTGRRFLQPDITTDNAQYQTLMDNAINQQADLELIPGVSLSLAQIQNLTKDMVWMEAQTITLNNGTTQTVLTPVVYIANASNYQIKNGMIIAGKDVNLELTNLKNAGLLEAGQSISLQALNDITNQGGTLQAGQSLSLLANNNINNISGNIQAQDISLNAVNGNINIKRFEQDVDYSTMGGIDTKKIIGNQSNIQASNNLSLAANNAVNIQGSNIQASEALNIQANTLGINTTQQNTNFFGGDRKNYVKERSTSHLNSKLNANDININTISLTNVTGSNLSAANQLNIQASGIDIKAVNNATYRETKSSSKGFMSKSVKINKKATSTNLAANLSAGNINLTTSKDNLNLQGSNLSAEGQLNLNAAKDLNIQAGYDGSLDESFSKKSRFSLGALITGGTLYSASEDLEGKLTKTAVNANLSGNNIQLNANNNINAVGVDITAQDSITGSGHNITIQNAVNEQTTYSKHNKIEVTLADVIGNAIKNPLLMKKEDDGKVSFTLATATIDKEAKQETKTTAQVSNLTSGAGGIKLKASAVDKADITQGKVNGEAREDALGYNINIQGSNLIANNGDINLTADNNVTIKEAIETTSTKSKEMHGKAELSFVVKNEYVQIKPALEAVKDAKKNISKAKDAYNDYQTNLSQQQTQLQALEDQLKANTGFIEQIDLDEMNELVNDLKDDKKYYQANIALAKASLVAKTTALVAQVATAVASSGTYGFNAGFELDIDALETQMQAHQTKAVASNLSANNINISSGNNTNTDIAKLSSTTIQGSNLNANNTNTPSNPTNNNTGQINLDSNNLNILSSQNTNNSVEDTEHKNLNLSYTVYGQGAGNLAGNYSQDNSTNNSQQTTHNNTTLNAANINITTLNDTLIKGATINASNQLNLTTNNLEVSSVSDKTKSKTRSQGASIGVGGSGVSSLGFNQAKANTNTKQVVLTSLTGNSVNIRVKDHTQLTGSTIAAVNKVTDAQGNTITTDNAQLNLTTNSLSANSLNTTTNNKSTSIGLNIALGNSKDKNGNNQTSIDKVGLDYANSKTNSKTKVLATLGQGNIQIADINQDDANSSTTLLNRDITNNSVDIYNIKSHKGLKGELDTRLLTKSGRVKIAEDIKKSGMIASAIKQIIKTDRTGVTDFFSEVDKLHKTDEAVKNKIANDPELAKTLTDPNLTPKQKQSLTTQLVNGVMIELGYQEVAEVKVVFDANDKTRQGHYSKDGDIYLNDASIDNTKDLVTTAGHEASHVIDKQNPNININPTTKADNEIYAENFGDYVEFASENYGDGNLASSNNHTGNNSSQTLKNNNRDYAQVDKSKGQDFLHINEEYDYANEMTNCGKTGYKCKNDTRKEYQAIYDKNKQDKIAEINKELNKPAFLRNRSNQEIKSAIDLVENRPFEEEITKIPEQSLNGVEVVSREKYVSRVEVETKKDAVATARAAANFVPVVRVINTGVAVVEGATKDYEDGGIDNSINNVIELIVPKIISKKIGISEKIPIGITTGISLGNDLSE